MANPESLDETIDRVFTQVYAEIAERATQEITEDQIIRRVKVQEIAEHLQGIQENGLAGMTSKFGRPLTRRELDALIRAVDKGKAPTSPDTAHFAPGLLEQIQRVATKGDS